MNIIFLLCVLGARALFFKNKVNEKVLGFIAEGRSDFELDFMKKALRKLNGKMARSLHDNHRMRSQEVKETLKTHNFGPREHIHDDFTKINKKLQEYLHQGDIVLNHEQISDLLTNKRDKRSAAYTLRKESKWPIDQNISYYFDYSFSESDKSLVRDGLSFWQNNTCLSFKENGETIPKIKFSKAGGCWSNLGRNWMRKEQTVSLDDGCNWFDTVVHEIGHALGVHHTQTRTDRDNFITLNPENIESDSAYNFDKMSKEENDNMDVAYDYGSVMHYSAYAFAVDVNTPTIMAKDWRYQKSMGSDGIPFSDISIMNRLYKCQEKRCPLASTKCYNNGLIDSNNCSKCICPAMWSGPTCLIRNPGRGSNVNNRSCGEDILVSSEWKSVFGAVGYTSRTTMAKSSECYWIFKAPIGKRVQLRPQITGSLCSSECYWQGVQIFTEGFEKGGMTFCCPSEVKNQLFTFSNHLAAIRVFSKFHVAHMAFDYRYI